MITDPNTIKRINRFLLETYGKDLLGRPYFRIVWSDDQFETRIGKISEWYGNIFIREIPGAHKVPKYSYVKHRWILEKLMFFSNPVKELPETEKGSHEPIYVFHNADYSPQPVTWEKVTWIVNSLAQRSPERRTEAMDAREDEEKFNRDVKKQEEMLDMSLDDGRFRSGSAVLNAGTGE